MINFQNDSTIIRDVNLSDHKSIFKIENLSFEEPYSKNTLKFFLNSFQCISILIEIDGIVVGYALGMLKFRAQAHIISIAIHPNYRNLGFGRKLLKKLLEIFKKKEKSVFELEVRISNDIAINLYKKFNFKIIDIKERYYTNGENAYLMELKLNSD